MKKPCPCNLLQNPYCIDIKHFSLDLLLILSIYSSCTGGRNRTGLSFAGGSGRQATSLLHPHIKTHRAREVARWGDPLRSGLLPFAWAIGTGRFCAHAATCRSAYAGLPCGHGLGNTDRSDFHRLIRKVSAAFFSIRISLPVLEDEQTLTGFHGICEQSGAGGVRPRSQRAAGTLCAI